MTAPRLKFTPTRPMAPEFAFRSQKHVEPLLRPPTVPTRVVTVRPYLFPAVRFVLAPEPKSKPAKRYAPVGYRTCRRKVCRALFPSVGASRLCESCERRDVPEWVRKGLESRAVNAATRERARREFARRHPRYESPDMQAGNA